MAGRRSCRSLDSQVPCMARNRVTSCCLFSCFDFISSESNDESIFCRVRWGITVSSCVSITFPRSRDAREGVQSRKGTCERIFLLQNDDVSKSDVTRTKIVTRPSSTSPDCRADCPFLDLVIWAAIHSWNIRLPSQRPVVSCFRCKLLI